MEVWKRIPGYRNYEASTKGRIRSVKREILYKRVGVLRTRLVSSRVLKPSPNKDGYLVVNVIRTTGKSISKYVHELVAAAFHGPRPERLQILHGNDHKKDNRPANLRYGTKFENYMDAVKNGRTKSKLNLRDINWVKKNKRLGVDKLSKLFKVPKSTIKMMLNGKTYKE